MESLCSRGLDEAVILARIQVREPRSESGMAQQLDFLDTGPAFPPGFRYHADVISRQLEDELLVTIRELPFKEFEFHGYVGNRRTVSFGWHYDFAQERVERTDPMPEFLLGLQETAAAFAGLSPDRLVQVLVTEYAPGAGIGWHRDKMVFGDVIGISLGSACQFRLRRKVGPKWERITVEAAPRSAYLLSGTVRTEWEHSIPAVETVRYSVTYRTLASASASGPR